ncbi:MAG: homocysteine S-methyltransferase family protein [Oscillospiraceae bacterium]|nr:homocysteine S-methyltransferase family protein [Oscillospiraceae bacterium]
MRERIVFIDGAMGTMLQQYGLELGQLPELLNLRHPESVTAIHREYVQAGADIITANTFQAHEWKLGDAASVEDVVTAGIQCARNAGAPFVALDIGPLGQLMEPMGTVTLAQAYEVYRRQIVAGAEAGADLIIIETISDPYEAKAAILAAKEHTDLPVFCTMTFQEDGRTFVGCDPLTAVSVLQGLGVDALGVNCSLGPASLRPVVDAMLRDARVPVVVQANAGLPVIRDGQTVYDISVEAYTDAVAQMVNAGVRIVGGCCGTTPAYIRALKARLSDVCPKTPAPRRATVCTSGTKAVVLDGVVTEIGERLNPTGKKLMKQALRDGDNGYLITEALRQVAAGAQVLDLNVGLPELDETAVLSTAVRTVQGATNAPLQIDSTSPEAIEAALRVYNGKAIINSVNGKQEVMEQIFPLAKKYGALVVGLALDEDGIPPTAQGRLEIARRIRDTARSYGIPDEDLLLDCLVLTASAQQEQVMETIRAITLVKRELGLKTVLGVSNVSFGLPQRELLNATFLAAALGAGLDAAILNPLAARYREVLDAFRVLNDEDRDSARYIEKYSQLAADVPTPLQTADTPGLAALIEQGRKDQTADKVRALLSDTEPLDIINAEFIPALDRVGKRFETGELFLPQLMLSAQAVQNGFAVIRDHMLSLGQRRESRGTILLATVQGDIHDIGKNIVRMLLENYGYDVLDLGKDVPIQTVVDAIREKDIRLAGLSALMTTTVTSMKDTITAVRDAGLPCTFWVGGAVLSAEYAQYVGADYYAADAMESVTIANRFFAAE